MFYHRVLELEGIWTSSGPTVLITQVKKTVAWNTQVTSARRSHWEVAKWVLKATLLKSGALIRSLGQFFLFQFGVLQDFNF